MKHEAVELLARYLKIDTTNPPGNEAKGAAFLAEILEKDECLRHSISQET